MKITLTEKQLRMVVKMMQNTPKWEKAGPLTCILGFNEALRDQSVAALKVYEIVKSA